MPDYQTMVDRANDCPLQLHIYAVDVANWRPSTEFFDMLLLNLPPNERSMVGKHKHFIDRKRSLTAKLLPRWDIWQRLRVASSFDDTHPTSFPTLGQFHIARNQYGKPFLVSPLLSQYTYSVSHHGSYVIFASAFDCYLGCDVMDVKLPTGETVDEYISIFKGSLSLREFETIINSANPLKAFYRAWCLKESFFKSLGIGIGLIPLSAVSFDFDASAKRSPNVEVQAEKLTIYLLDEQKEIRSNEMMWQFVEGWLDETHCWALAIGRSAIGFNKSKHDSMLQPSVTIIRSDDFFNLILNC